MKLTSIPGPPWIYTVITLMVILWLTLTPQPLPEMGIEWFPGADKIVHAIMFGGLVGAACFDRLRIKGLPTLRFVIVAAVASGALGGVIEILQANYIEGRSGDLDDLLGDLLGCIVAVFVSRPLLRALS